MMVAMAVFSASCTPDPSGNGSGENEENGKEFTAFRTSDWTAGDVILLGAGDPVSFSAVTIKESEIKGRLATFTINNLPESIIYSAVVSDKGADAVSFVSQDGNTLNVKTGFTEFEYGYASAFDPSFDMKPALAKVKVTISEPAYKVVLRSKGGEFLCPDFSIDLVSGTLTGSIFSGANTLECILAEGQRVAEFGIFPGLKFNSGCIVDVYSSETKKLYSASFADSWSAMKPGEVKDLGTISSPVESPATKLLSKMTGIAKTGVMFGMQDATVMGWGWRGDYDDKCDVYELCGDYPAVIGFDLSNMEKDSYHDVDWVEFEWTKKRCKEHYDRGGVITFSWHCSNMISGGNYLSQEPQGKVVSSLIEGGEYHEDFIHALDNIAKFFNELKGSDGKTIPVIFRPWHEHSADHFWWGTARCSKNDFVELWRETHDYIAARCPQVLFCYSTSSNVSSVSDYLARYPGDQYIDMLGFDAYCGSSESLSSYIRKMQSLLAILKTAGERTGKLICVSETGNSKEFEDAKWWTEGVLKALEGYNPSYVLVWRGSPSKSGADGYGPYKGCPSEKDFVDFYNSSRTYFNYDIRNIYK